MKITPSTSKNGKAKRTGAKPKVGPPFKAPELVKVPCAFKLPYWLLEWMRSQEQSMAVLIEEALTEKHGLEAPTPKARTK
jgi:hypothetical protein